MEDNKWNVGILLFDEVEVLDFAGPFETFSITKFTESKEKPFKVKTISETGKLISARNGLKVQPDYSFQDNARFDIVVIPGGYGAEAVEIHNEKVIDWIKRQAEQVDILASVCTGAYLLGKAGVLNGKNATTHWMDIDDFQEKFPEVKVQKDVKFVQDGKTITSAGVSAGINMSLHIIEQLLSKNIATASARAMEYDISL